MDDRVWVGPTSRCPAGWSVCDSIEALLTTPGTPSWIVVDDQAGVLRESGFARLYEHFPLTKIERIVGPWRAGVGRTDPQWPLVTTRREQCISGANTCLETAWSPLTSGYDDLAVEDAVPNLTGLAFNIQITDLELREMWADWLTCSGGELRSTGQVDVLIRDTSQAVPVDELSGARCIVTLAPDPWNTATTSSTDNLQRGQAFTLAVSILDSPARVTQRALAILPRAIC
jgi:hypothetical protein